MIEGKLLLVRCGVRRNYVYGIIIQRLSKKAIHVYNLSTARFVNITICPNWDEYIDDSTLRRIEY